MASGATKPTALSLSLSLSLLCLHRAASLFKALESRRMSLSIRLCDCSTVSGQWPLTSISIELARQRVYGQRRVTTHSAHSVGNVGIVQLADGVKTMTLHSPVHLELSGSSARLLLCLSLSLSLSPSLIIIIIIILE